MKIRIKDIKVGDKIRKENSTYLVITKNNDWIKVGDFYLNEVELNTQGFELLKPKTKKVKKWVPQMGEIYYRPWLTLDGEGIDVVKCLDRSSDTMSASQNRCFDTKQLALKALKKIERVLRLSKHS